MLRLYFDTQIVTYLQEFPEGKAHIYEPLKNILTESRDELMLLFSIGHLSDYSRDTTDLKDKDLRYMEEMGCKYFINHNSSGPPGTCISKGTPYDVFKKRKSSSSLSIAEKRKLPVYKKLIEVFEVLYEPYLYLLNKFEESGLNSLSQTERNSFIVTSNVVQLSSGEITKDKYVDSLWSHMDTINSGSDAGIRDYLNSLNIRGKTGSPQLIREVSLLDFSKPTLKYVLKDTNIQNFFLDTILALARMRGVGEFGLINDEFTINNAYYSFELNGLVNERRRNKIKYKNVASDAAHTTFASYCDVLITDDEPLYKKAKVLYGVLDINTYVLTSEEFINYFHDEYLHIKLNGKQEILDSIQTETFGFLHDYVKEFKTLPILQNFDSQRRYFDFFNTIEYKSKGDKYIARLIRITNNYMCLYTLDEIQALIKATIDCFGVDIENRSYFHKLESKSIYDSLWPIRVWHVSGMIISLVADLSFDYHVSLIFDRFISPDIKVR